jgi:hypothetical protein
MEMRIQHECGRLTNMSVAAFLKVQTQCSEGRHAKPHELLETSSIHGAEKIALCAKMDKCPECEEKVPLVGCFRVPEQDVGPYVVVDVLAPAALPVCTLLGNDT